MDIAGTVLFSLLCLVGFGIILVAVILGVIFKRVPQNQNWVVTRLGETSVKGPGSTIQLPFVDQVVKVDLSEKPTNVQDQTCITRDRAPVIIHMLVYTRAVAPIQYASQTNRQRQDFLHLCSGSLKEMVGERTLDQILSARDELGSAVCEKLSKEVDPALGIRIEKVKVLEIVASKEVLASTAAAAKIPGECPSCGGPINEQAARGKQQIKCEYCGFLINL